MKHETWNKQQRFFCYVFHVTCYVSLSCLYTVPSTPLTNFPDVCPENVFASSMASLMATLGGTSSLLLYKSSYKPILNTFRSMMGIWEIGHSGAAFSMMASISKRC